MTTLVYYNEAMLYLFILVLTLQLHGNELPLSRIDHNIKSNPQFELTDKNYLKDFDTFDQNGDLQVVVEIPTGTIDKWEVRKTDGALVWEKNKGIPRVVNYIGYPGNYGMVPKTIFSKLIGGDGDPLDAIVLGPPVPRGSIISVKIIGLMEMKDSKEADHKLLCVAKNTHFYTLNSINDLINYYPGVMKILKIWFSNYKGQGVITKIQIKSNNTAKNLLDKVIID
jgi:inorganic pyrophosphatase